jgi:hypothetical protein
LLASRDARQAQADSDFDGAIEQKAGRQILFKPARNLS